MTGDASKLMLSFLDVLACGMSALILLFLASTITKYDVPEGSAKRGFMVEWTLADVGSGAAAAKALMVPYFAPGVTAPLRPVHDGSGLGQGCTVFCRASIGSDTISVLTSTFVEQVAARSGASSQGPPATVMIMHVSPDTSGCWRFGVMIHNHSENFVVTSKDEFTLSARVWISDTRKLDNLGPLTVGAGRLIPQSALRARPEEKTDLDNGVLCLRQ